MQSTLKAAAASGLAAGLIAGLATWTYLMMEIPNATPVLSAILAAIPGGVLAVVVGGLVVLLRRYPGNARTAAIFATVACVALTAILAFGASQNKEPFNIGPYAMAWCLVWPIAFVVSLWVDVKRAVAKKIVDGVKSTRSK
jgi:hypothetical protein